MSTRTLTHVIESTPTSDGAGVKLRRSLGSQRGVHVDPFLMLDEFYSDNPDDYLAGFPAHPHRGFETVTYMLDGHMRHEDQLGNRGDLGPGSVQWMTAARGIIHSEMPQQSEGRMRGFQLWLNLPSKEKMKPAGYRDIPAREIPTVPLPQGGEVKVIAGTLALDGGATSGPVNGTGPKLSTDPLYLDVHLPPGAEFSAPVTAGHNAFVYTYEGTAESHGRRFVRGRRRARAGRRRRRALLAAGGEAAARAGRAVRSVRDEHPRRNRAGARRLSGREAGRRGLKEIADGRRLQAEEDCMEALETLA
jgi:hypothetical protein